MNALADLAEKLNADTDIVLALKKYLGDKENEVGGMMIQDIRKAQRIIAELAKVTSEPGGQAYWVDSAKAVTVCRAIAVGKDGEA